MYLCVYKIAVKVYAREPLSFVYLCIPARQTIAAKGEAWVIFYIIPIPESDSRYIPFYVDAYFFRVSGIRRYEVYQAFYAFCRWLCTLAEVFILQFAVVHDWLRMFCSVTNAVAATSGTWPFPMALSLSTREATP